MRSYFAHIDLFDLLRDLDPAVEEGSAVRDAGDVPSVLTIPLLPRGQFKHEQYGDLDWSDEKFSEMQANHRARVTGYVPMVNADHATHNPFASSAPAYAWFQDDLVIDGVGLGAPIKLTRLGKEAIRDETYRYLSAEIADEYTDSQGNVYHNVVMGAGFTNTPFHDTMRGLFAAKPQARCFSQHGPASFWAADRSAPEGAGGTMTLLEKIREKFKLPATASEDDALAAVAALEAVEPPEAATEEAETAAGTQQLAVTPETLDLSKHPTVMALTQQVAELAGRVKKADEDTAAAQKALLEKGAADAVEAFVRSGKIAPAQRETALKFALADPILFQAHYEHAPPVIDLAQRGFGGEGKPAGGAADDFHGQVLQAMQREHLDYTAAAQIVAENNPDLYERHRAAAAHGRAN